MIQKIKGTMDILPDETPLFRYIEGIMREEAEKFGFGEIRLPTFELTELFVRGVGNTTDVVQKEMYTFMDGEDSISLRPEGTAGTVRALIENGKYGDAMPQKYYYIMSCFRHEKPQAGRSREFFQFGVEMFGAETASADATVISLAYSVLRRLGLDKYVTLHVNSIGCADCRPTYKKALTDYFADKLPTLCETCRERFERNPLRLLDCKVPTCAAIAKEAPKTVDSLCEKCDGHFKALLRGLDAMEIPYVIDSSIVRGLDYYTGTVFEFVAEGIGAQSTVCGGGRYDGLVASLGGPALSGIGFGMGLTRLILALNQHGINPVAPVKPRLYVASLGEAAQIHALSIVSRLRREGLYAECDLVGRSLKAQMKYADKIGAAYTLIIGDNEIETRKANLRNMATSEQTEVDIDAFTL